MMQTILNEEIEFLQQSGYSINIVEEGNLSKLIISDFPLPDGYSKQSSDLLILIPPSYPNGKLDMFWLEEEVLLEDGYVPNRANVIEIYIGRKWRRFSWHLSKWNPGRDNLTTYISFIEKGLIEARER